MSARTRNLLCTAGALGGEGGGAKLGSPQILSCDPV